MEAAIFALIVVFWIQDFWIAILNYIPAVMFLILSFVVRLLRKPDRFVGIGLAGVVLTLLAAAVQHLRVSFSVRFNHNALYHLLQGIALLLIFLAARELIRAESHNKVNHAE